MNYEEYEKALSEIKNEASLARVPIADYTLYVCFGSICPAVAGKRHLLVQGCSPVFTLIQQILRAEMFILNVSPPFIPSEVEEESESWSHSSNQMWLAENIENLKFESGIRLVADVQQWEKNKGAEYQTKLKQAVLGQSTTRDFFQCLAAEMDNIGVAYVSLPEITSLDLLIVSEARSTLLAELESKLSSSGFKVFRLQQKEGRAYWPSFEPS